MKTRAETIAALGLPSVESIIERVEAALPKTGLFHCDDCPESTVLTEVFDALCEYIDDYWSHSGPSDGPPELTVYAFERDTIGDKDYAAAVEYAARVVVEHLEESFGGDDPRRRVDVAEREMAAAFLPIVRQHYVQDFVRTCSQVGKDCDLSEEECWSLMLAECCDEDLVEWVEAAKAWLAGEKPEDVAPELATAEAS